MFIKSIEYPASSIEYLASSIKHQISTVPSVPEPKRSCSKSKTEVFQVYSQAVPKEFQILFQVVFCFFCSSFCPKSLIQKLEKITPKLHQNYTEFDLEWVCNALEAPRKHWNSVISHLAHYSLISTGFPSSALSMAPNTIARLFILSVQIVSGVSPVLTHRMNSLISPS